MPSQIAKQQHRQALCPLLSILLPSAPELHGPDRALKIWSRAQFSSSHRCALALFRVIEPLTGGERTGVANHDAPYTGTRGAADGAAPVLPACYHTDYRVAVWSIRDVRA